MKKLALSIMALSAINATATDKITSYSPESHAKVALTTLAASSLSGTLALFVVGDLENTASKVFVSLAALAGGGAGWWWSSNRTPEERFNYAAHLLNHDSTKQIMGTVLNATSGDDIFARADNDFKCHRYPRAKMMNAIEWLYLDLRNTIEALTNAVATELDRSNPNRFLIDQGRVHLKTMETYVTTLNTWIPILKNDAVYLMQKAAYCAEKAQEAAERAETEARFARMDADMACWEARQERARQIHLTVKQ